MENHDLIDKVIYQKGRVWTIYGISGPGVFCFQGVKPYPSFKYIDRDGFYTIRRFNTSYFLIEELNILEDEDIEHHIKLMEKADKQKMTRKKAVEFFAYLTGHTKSFVSKNVHEKHHSFAFSPGYICYDVWKSDEALLLSHNTDGGYTHMSYFDFITFEPHDILNDKRRDSIRDEIIDGYKDSQI